MSTVVVNFLLLPRRCWFNTVVLFCAFHEGYASTQSAFLHSENCLFMIQFWFLQDAIYLLQVCVRLFITGSYQLSMSQLNLGNVYAVQQIRFWYVEL